MNPPYSPACDRNKAAIETQLLRICGEQPQRFLELGSGTGQHALHFATEHPHWHWQAADRPPALPGIAAWLQQNPGNNTPPALPWDVEVADHWAALPSRIDWLYTANTFHIMSWAQVKKVFAGISQYFELRRGLLVYGPFVREEVPTSPSNLQFDAQLRAQDPQMGLRELSAVQSLAVEIGLNMREVVAMPANNLLVYFSNTDGI